MRQRKETFRGSAASIAGLIFGGFVALWAVKLLFEGTKLAVGEWEEFQRLRNTNPDELDRQIVLTMRAYHWDTPLAREWWDTLKSILYPYEVTRIEAKIEAARKWFQPRPSSSQTTTATRATYKSGKRGKKGKARRTRTRNPFTKAAPAARQLNAAPPAVETPAQVETAAPVVKAKGGRVEGSRNKKTNRILAAYDRYIEAGKTDEEARGQVTADVSKESKRGIKSVRRSVDKAVNRWRHSLE